MNKDTPVLQFTIKDVLGVSYINIDKGFTLDEIIKRVETV